jgi:hypothetical protein
VIYSECNTSRPRPTKEVYHINKRLFSDTMPVTVIFYSNIIRTYIVILIKAENYGSKFYTYLFAFTELVIKK